MNQENLRKFIEIAAIGLGISGLSLANLQIAHPIFYYSALTVLVITLISLLFTWRNYNIFTQKKVINNTWQDLLEGATESIEIFAGDASWAKRDKETLQKAINVGKRVNILCYSPGTNMQRQVNVRTLFEAGAKIKFFDKREYSPPYGLLIDGDDQNNAQAFNVSKEPKTNVNLGMDGLERPELYSYKAIRYIPEKDSYHLQAISTLFKSMWEHSKEGVSLTQVDIDKLKNTSLINLLHLVSHYSSISKDDVDFDTVSIDDLYASCTYVKHARLKAINQVCYSYQEQDISPYRPCFVMTNMRQSLLLPPIVEYHDSKLVVVDGTHRLFHLYAIQQKTNAFCMIIKNTPELPGVPVPFRDVKAWPRNLPREQVFIEYKPYLYRYFTEMDDRLTHGSFKKDSWNIGEK